MIKLYNINYNNDMERNMKEINKYTFIYPLLDLKRLISRIYAII